MNFLYSAALIVFAMGMKWLVNQMEEGEARTRLLDALTYWEKCKEWDRKVDSLEGVFVKEDSDA